MKFTTDTKALRDALEWTGKAVPARPNHPILANVLINGLTVTGFDLSIGIKAKLQGQLVEEGSVTLPSKLFSEIVKKLPNGEVTIESDEEAIATIQSSSGKYQIRGLAAGEYPELPSVKGESISIPAQAILDGAKALEFASTDETRQVLCGIHLKIKADGFEFAATNGHCLMTVVIPVESEETEEGEDSVEEKKEIAEFSITIPARAFREVERMVLMYKSLLDNVVRLHYEKEQVVFEMAGQRVICRAMEGTYPAYPQLIPSKFTNLITVNRRGFLGALERVAVVAMQKNDVAICAIDSINQQISLSADVADVGSASESLPAQISAEEPKEIGFNVADVGSASESLPAQISAEEPKEIGFNVKYLVTALKEFNTSEISLQLNSESSPVVMVPVGGLKMLFLLMPVHLRK